MKHFRIYIIATVVVLVAWVWLAAYINVNKRFPQPEEELYEKENGLRYQTESE